MLLIILHYKSTLIIYELCGSVVIYPQYHHMGGGFAVGRSVDGSRCYVSNIILLLSVQI